MPKTSDAHSRFIPICSAEQLAASHNRLQRVIAYLTRNIDTILEPAAEDSPMVIAMFDRNGYLLKMFGSEEAVAKLKEAGISTGTVWTLEALGPNAVSTGLAEDRALSGTGDENAHAVLKEYALYFSPLALKKVDTPLDKIYAGLAIIVPVERHNPDYLVAANSISHDTIMTLHFNQIAFSLFEQSGRGILSIDTQINRGKNTITYFSNCIFDFFDMPPLDVKFKPAEQFVDPLPKNREFWAILRNEEKVADHALTLSCRGKKVPCIVSTTVYEQPGINVRGVIFLITTPQEISASVSKKMANSAIRSFDNIIGESNAVASVIRRGKMFAKTDSNVMLLGESGVGKDVFAQAIHNYSSRAGKPFIAINCGALPRDLIASELFGYAGGAFTGAKNQGNLGKFELANEGTIFLDEIGELPLDTQATLLRIVEQKQLMRVGGNKQIDIDVKIISATNADIPQLIEQKLFRADLYYRLSTMQLHLPPLRERGQDVILLAEHFIRTIAVKIGKERVQTISENAKELLLTIPWQGNVRELQNLMENIVQLYPDDIIGPEHIRENMLHIRHSEPESYMHTAPRYRPSPARHRLSEADILAALEACGGNRSEAARYLGIARKTLYRNMERLGM